MFNEWLLPQLQEDSANLIFVEAGAGQDIALTHWPPRNPDLMPCDFFSCGDISETEFFSSISCDCKQCKAIGLL
jgi:hypothetical protein